MAPQAEIELSVNILLGVSGGVAAYKAVDLASKLTQANARVQTILTENAQRFVGALSFESVSKGPVHTTMWQKEREYKIGHINLAEWADLVVVAPATANIIAKTAGGICDDMLSTTLCVCWQKPWIMAPAMNERMWENPVTKENVEKLKKLGAVICGPGKGKLACGDEGMGRMSETDEIMAQIVKTAEKIC